MDSYLEHKVFAPDYRRIASEIARTAEFADFMGQKATAARLRDHAALMREGFEPAHCPAEFLFRF
jgi:hypothetical protein